MTVHDREPDLPALSVEEERRLTELLQSAFMPQAIDPQRHEHLLDPFAAPSAEEIVESERLRRALDSEVDADVEGDHLDLVLARALAAAHAPSAVAPKVVPPATLTSAPAAVRASGRVPYVRFGAALAGLAAAAALLLAIGSRSRPASAPAPDLPALALAQSRSTAPLFQNASVEPPSARIDRIASVRERDLRANRYALWGVR